MNKKLHKILLNKIIICALIVSCVFLITSCSRFERLTSKILPSKDMTYEEIKKKISTDRKVNKDTEAQHDPLSAQSSEPPLPNISPIIVPPEPPSLAKDKLVTLSITEDVPLKDVLVELSRLGEVDTEIDSKITGGIILRVKDRPFNEVVDRICDMANLRYNVKNGILKIERDLPYLINYNLDFLNLVRSNKGSSSVTTSSSVSSGGSGGSGGGSSGGGSGSSNEIQSSYDGDLWHSIESDVRRILGLEETKSSSASQNKDANPETTPYLTINKQASVISVFTNKKQHTLVTRYMEKIKDSVSAQVLIEAKIVEVTLNDDFRSGINWGAFEQAIGNLKITGEETQVEGVKTKPGIFDSRLSTPITSTPDKLSFSLSGLKNLNAAVTLTQMFGNTRTLSSPRLNAMNNQQAVLSFVKNSVYFTVKVDMQTNSSSTAVQGTTNGPSTANTSSQPTVTVNSTPNTVPIGVILTLQPSINLDTSEITMNVRPTITRLSGDSVQDPAVAYILAQAKNSADQGTTDALKGISSTVPVIEVKEVDSIIKIKSGEIMVIGGMMEESSQNTDSGIPYLMNAPLIGNLFKGVAKTNSTVQTIIFIKATIVPSDRMKPKDHEMYQNFARDDDDDKI